MNSLSIPPLIAFQPAAVNRIPLRLPPGHRRVLLRLPPGHRPDSSGYCCGSLLDIAAAPPWTSLRLPPGHRRDSSGYCCGSLWVLLSPPTNSVSPSHRYCRDSCSCAAAISLPRTTSAAPDSTATLLRTAAGGRKQAAIAARSAVDPVNGFAANLVKSSGLFCARKYEGLYNYFKK